MMAAHRAMPAAEGFELSLAEAARALGTAPPGGKTVVRGVSTDSRTLQAGELFVALRGPSFDGHDFVDAARERGAAAYLLDHAVAGAEPALIVPDTRLALGRLARHWRERFSAPLVAVTGSNGKTTVKEMLAAILGTLGPTLATRGNLNNDIGVPLTLFGLRPGHRYAVIEMGANHPGEIAYLTDIARPDVALITNAGEAHLEGFGSVAGVARAKGEIYGGLGPDGVAVINADDTYASLWVELAGGRRQIRFALEAKADVSAEWRPAGAGSELAVRTPAGDFEVQLPLAGRHNVMNALAACAAASAVGCSTEAMRAGLAGLRPVPGRLVRRAAYAGAALIDDTYNANPGSLQAALDVLAACDGERYFVLGDMAELGESGVELHTNAGERARVAGVERLYCLGELAAAACERFGAGARAFNSREALIEALRGELHAGVTVLLKGSRRMKLDEVVAALVTEGEG
ncbi:MAG TPA: UDP-N-acetylmuramoyl-tripeptide--D-alanyl-D-alanine ligase [Gammaproteobacteria bacterium]|nr:UDP-N-acetylmuramoyl-tripeptide--D-alanyl-D-alanine ligase [Gammaproteobacteria bacterium]